jgi:hypothetical protein
LGDAVHAIRSSLDYFAYAAVPTPGRNTEFPIPRQAKKPTVQDLKSLVEGNVAGASQQLRQALRALEPYPGGNGEYLWLIHDLDSTDKHHRLITMGSAYRVITFDAATMLRGLADWTQDLPAMLIGLRPISRCPIEEGTVLFTADPDFFEQQKDLKFSFDIAFSKPQILEGEPVVPTLRSLLDKVEGLLKRLIPLV